MKEMKAMRGEKRRRRRRRRRNDERTKGQKE